MVWKCTNCGYIVDTTLPPGQCPSCREKCDFVDVSCYIPDCGGPGGVVQDERLIKGPGDNKGKPV